MLKTFILLYYYLVLNPQPFFEDTEYLKLNLTSPPPASKPGQYITLNVTEIETECSYDHLYVYDGQTFDSPLLGVFSGRTRPPQVTAGSGYMLVLLYSDTNYVLEGFVAEYSVTGGWVFL